MSSWLRFSRQGFPVTAQALNPTGQLLTLKIKMPLFYHWYSQLYIWVLLPNAPLPWQLAQHLQILRATRMRFLGQLQLSYSKFCVQNVSCLQQSGLTFKFWEITQGNNSLCCLGSLMHFPNQLERTGFFSPVIMRLCYSVALGRNNIAPSHVAF